MADIADLAQEDMERDAPYILAAAKKPAGPVACGTCHNCGEPVAPDTKFCDVSCRDDYDNRQRLAARGVGA
jgi:hypothetical protein